MHSTIIISYENNVLLWYHVAMEAEPFNVTVNPAAFSVVPPASPSRTDKRLARRAVWVLSFCCLCWGFSFPVAQFGLRAFESHMPAGTADTLIAKLGVNATFNGWRFALTALFYGLLTFSSQRGFTRDEVKGGVLIGGFFSLGIFVQLAGLRYTLPSISSFLTALVVVFAPLAQALASLGRTQGRRPVGAWTWLAVCIALLGITILSQPDPCSMACNTVTSAPPFPYMGEGLTILGSLFFTAQLLALDHYGRQADPARLTWIMFAVTAVLSTLMGVILSRGEIYSSRVILPLLNDHTLQWTISSMVVFSSVVAVHLMIKHQPRLSPATASVIYCLEPVFATLFSLAFQTETITAFTGLGGAMILLAVLIVARKA